MSEFKKTAELFLMERFGVEPISETPTKDALLSEDVLRTIIEQLSEEKCKQLDCFINELTISNK